MIGVDRLRGLLRALRRDAHRRDGRAVDDRLPRRCRARRPRCSSPPRWRSSSRAFPVSERGRALALFFGIAGGLTAVGPLLGGYLTEWTWRSIFWINMPVALVALVLTDKAKPAQERQAAPIDYRGAVLDLRGVGLVVLGLQQAGGLGLGRRRGRSAASSPACSCRRVRRQRAARAIRWSDVRVFAVRAFAFDNGCWC